jgi:hypothetical protein
LHRRQKQQRQRQAHRRGSLHRLNFTRSQLVVPSPQNAQPIPPPRFARFASRIIFFGLFSQPMEAARIRSSTKSSDARVRDSYQLPRSRDMGNMRWEAAAAAICPRKPLLLRMGSAGREALVVTYLLPIGFLTVSLFPVSPL